MPTQFLVQTLAAEVMCEALVDLFELLDANGVSQSPVGVQMARGARRNGDGWLVREVLEAIGGVWGVDLDEREVRPVDGVAAAGVFGSQ